MCGIAGIVCLETVEPPSERRLRQMLAMIRHRGPDQFGIYLDEFAGLGSARLSIIDLGGGQQPIRNENGNLWIVFNGEVFNYVELRKELEGCGHRFATHTDTEVVLHAYEEFGAGCLNRFNGQFAIAIWDRSRRELFLARDRLGVRPLFYAQFGGSFVFASEIKAILADERVRAELDPVAIDQIFTYWSAQPPRTAFENIRELPAGHHAFVRNGSVNVKRYWALDFPTEQEREAERSLNDCVDEFRELLTEAVRLRLRADVPVGAYLSGGLDSSVVAALVRRIGAGRLDTFSIAFGDPRFDESGFQRCMARFLGTDHQVVHITHSDIGKVFPEVIWHTETPVTRTAPAPMFLLSKLVRSHGYKVVLTGEGADEFLAGYDIFKEAAIRRFWARNPQSQWRPLLLQRLYSDVGALAGTSAAYREAFFGAGLEARDDPFFSHAIRWHNTRRTRRFFVDTFRHRIESAGGGLEHRPQLPDKFHHWHPLSRAQFLEVNTFLSPYLLASQGDRPAMAHSVEGRFPFLDVNVVEFCNRLPARFKLNGLKDKFLLRCAACEWLPEEIWRRPKRPYRAPIHHSFFNVNTPDYVNELLAGNAVRRAGIFNARTVERLVAKIEDGGPVGETDDMALVGVLSTQLIHELFINRFSRSEPLGASDDVKLVDLRGFRCAVRT